MQTATKAPIDEIYCQLIPLRQLRLIVPRTCVAEVVRHVQPEQPWTSPGWFRGFIAWNNLRVPLV